MYLFEEKDDQTTPEVGSTSTDSASINVVNSYGYFRVTRTLLQLNSETKGSGAIAWGVLVISIKKSKEDF